jgi:hypothetical protein
MDTARFDRISSMFAQNRLTRRRAIQTGTAGLAAVGLAATGLKAAVAQDASPAADAGDTRTLSSSEFLFVQSFESGSIAPKEGAEGAYTLTLQHGLGQTLFFSNRPERIVGATPTPTFLEGLGFSPDNPPNAALVIGTEEGGTDIAVVELTNPTYDTASSTATYDVSVLENYEAEIDMELQEAPADLAAVAASFGAAHLFIDDCADGSVTCMHWNGNQGLLPSEGGRPISPVGFCWNWATFRCEPCDGDGLTQACFDQFPDFCDRAQDNCRISW